VKYRIEKTLHDERGFYCGTRAFTLNTPIDLEELLELQGDILCFLKSCRDICEPTRKGTPWFDGLEKLITKLDKSLHKRA
jgi:hypothetical protein